MFAQTLTIGLLFLASQLFPAILFVLLWYWGITDGHFAINQYETDDHDEFNQQPNHHYQS